MALHSKTTHTYEEHPFAPYVRILGKGKKGSRSLTHEEAMDAMGMILAGKVEEVQLGAFLMLLRVKEETPEELAGFVKAVKQTISAPAHLDVDLDWSSYAGKRRHLPWFLLSIFALANQGVRTFIHGASGHTEGRLYTENILQALGFNVCSDWHEVEASVNTRGFGYLKLNAISPVLDSLINLRPVLGLRSPVHSLSRLINPLNADTVVQGIFHPPYLTLHQQAGALLNYNNFAVIKGEGGEIERNPDNDMLAKVARNGQCSEELWPALFERRHTKGEELTADYLRSVWRAETKDEYGESAAISTMALALRTMNKADSIENSMALAEDFWNKRELHFI